MTENLNESKKISKNEFYNTVRGDMMEFLTTLSAGESIGVVSTYRSDEFKSKAKQKQEARASRDAKRKEDGNAANKATDFISDRIADIGEFADQKLLPNNYQSIGNWGMRYLRDRFVSDNFSNKVLGWADGAGLASAQQMKDVYKGLFESNGFLEKLGDNNSGDIKAAISDQIDTYLKSLASDVVKNSMFNLVVGKSAKTLTGLSQIAGTISSDFILHDMKQVIKSKNPLDIENTDYLKRIKDVMMQRCLAVSGAIQDMKSSAGIGDEFSKVELDTKIKNTNSLLRQDSLRSAVIKGDSRSIYDNPVTAVASGVKTALSRGLAVAGFILAPAGEMVGHIPVVGPAIKGVLNPFTLASSYGMAADQQSSYSNLLAHARERGMNSKQTSELLAKSMSQVAQDVDDSYQLKGGKILLSSGARMLTLSEKLATGTKGAVGGAETLSEMYRNLATAEKKADDENGEKEFNLDDELSQFDAKNRLFLDGLVSGVKNKGLVQTGIDAGKSLFSKEAWAKFGSDIGKIGTNYLTMQVQGILINGAASSALNSLDYAVQNQTSAASDKYLHERISFTTSYGGNPSLDSFVKLTESSGGVENFFSNLGTNIISQLSLSFKSLNPVPGIDRTEIVVDGSKASTILYGRSGKDIQGSTSVHAFKTIPKVGDLNDIQIGNKVYKVRFDVVRPGVDTINFSVLNAVDSPLNDVVGFNANRFLAHSFENGKEAKVSFRNNIVSTKIVGSFVDPKKNIQSQVLRIDKLPKGLEVAKSKRDDGTDFYQIVDSASKKIVFGKGDSGGDTRIGLDVNGQNIDFSAPAQGLRFNKEDGSIDILIGNADPSGVKKAGFELFSSDLSTKPTSSDTQGATVPSSIFTPPSEPSSTPATAERSTFTPPAVVAEVPQAETTRFTGLTTADQGATPQTSTLIPGKPAVVETKNTPTPTPTPTPTETTTTQPQASPKLTPGNPAAVETTKPNQTTLFTNPLPTSTNFSFQDNGTRFQTNTQFNPTASPSTSSIFTPSSSTTLTPGNPVPVKVEPITTTQTNTPVLPTLATPPKVETVPTPASSSFNVVGENSFKKELDRRGLLTGRGDGVVYAKERIVITLDNNKSMTYNPGDRVDADDLIRLSGNGAINTSKLSELKIGITSINGSNIAAQATPPTPFTPTTTTTTTNLLFGNQSTLKPSSTSPFNFSTFNQPKIDPVNEALINSGNTLIKAQEAVLKQTQEALDVLNKVPNKTPEQTVKIKELEARQKTAQEGLKKNTEQRDALIRQQNLQNPFFGNIASGLPSFNINNNSSAFNNLFNSNSALRNNLTPIDQAAFRADILKSLKTSSDSGRPLDYTYTPEESAKIRDLDRRIEAVNKNTNLNNLGKAKLAEELRNQKLEIFADAMTRDAVAKQYTFNSTVRLPQSVLNQLSNATILPVSPLTQLNAGITTKLPEGTIPLEINSSLAGAKFGEIFKPIQVDPKTLIDLPGDKNNSTVKVGDKVYQLKYVQTTQGLVGVVLGEDGKYNTINSSDPRVQSYLNQNTVVNGKSVSIRQILSTGFNPADLLGENSNSVEAKVYSELPTATASLKTLLPNRTMISSLELPTLVPQLGKSLLAALPKEYKDSLPFQTFSGTISNQELDLILAAKTDKNLAQELSNFNKIIDDLEKSSGLTRAQIASRLDSSVDGLALRRLIEITDLYGKDNKLQVSDLQRVKGVEVGSVVIQGARTVVDARNNTAIQSGLLGYGLFVNPANKALFDNTLGVRDNGIPMVFSKAIGTVRDYSSSGMKGNGATDRFDSESYNKMVSAWKDFKAGKLDDISLDVTTLAQIKAVLSTKGVNLTNEQVEEIVFMKYYLDHIENGQNWAWGRLGVGDFKPGKDLLQEYQTNFAKYNKVDTSQNINTNVKTTSADLAINQEGLKDIMQNPFKAVSAAVSLLTGSGTIGVQITTEQNIENAFTGKRASAAKYDDASKTITIDRNKLGSDAPTAVQLLQIAKGLGLDSSIPFAIMSGSSTESSSTSATVGSIKINIVGQPSRAEQAVTGSIIQNLRDNAKAIYRDDMDPKVSLYKAVAANLEQLRAQGKLTDAEYKVSIDLAQKSTDFVLTYRERIRLTNGGSLGDLGVLAKTDGYTVTGYTVPIENAVRTSLGVPINEIKKFEGGDIYDVSQKLFNASGKTLGMSDSDAASMAKQLIDLRRTAVSAGRLTSSTELQNIKVPEGFEISTKKMSVAAKSGIVKESTLQNGRKVYTIATVHTGLNGQGQIDGRIIDQSEDPEVITLINKKTGKEILIGRNSPHCPQGDASIEIEDTASISVDCRQTGNCTPMELDMLSGRFTANQDTLNTVVVMNQASLNTDRAFTGGAQELVKAISAAEKTNAAIAKPLSEVLKNPTPEALTKFQQETGVAIDPAIAQSLSKQGMILDAQTTLVSIRQQYKEKFGIDIGPMMIGFNWGDSGKIDAEAEVSLRITSVAAETERDASGALSYKLDANGQPIPCFNVEVTSKGKSSKEWENKGSVIIQLPIPKPPKPPEPPREPPKVRPRTDPTNPNAPITKGPEVNVGFKNPVKLDAPRTVVDPNSPFSTAPTVTPVPQTTIPVTPATSAPNLNTPFSSTPSVSVPAPFQANPVVPTPFSPTLDAPLSTGAGLGNTTGI